MSEDAQNEARDAFHVAKLALTNIRLLHDIQQARDTSCEVADLVKARLKMDQLRPPVSLLHQASFLQFAYVCLVWLWERSKADHVEDEVVRRAKNRFEFASAIGTVTGPRDVSSAKDVLRLMRNAISHARVRTEDNTFVFEDGSIREGFTSLSLTWSELGEVSEAVLFAVNDILCPRSTDD